MLVARTVAVVPFASLAAVLERPKLSYLYSVPYGNAKMVGPVRVGGVWRVSLLE